MAFVLAESSPHAERFARGEGAFPAQLKDRATVAVLLGGFGTTAARSTALAFWVKKQIGVCFAT